MKLKSLIFVLVTFLSFASFSQSFKGSPTGKEIATIQNAEFEKEIFKLVNEIRTNHYLKPLQWQEDLARAARYHSRDMAYDSYVEHATYDRKNNRLVKVCETFERVEKFIDFPYLGENISVGKNTAIEAVDGWMKSKGHRANILNPNFKYLGVGYFYLENTIYQYYWVQDFGG